MPQESEQASTQPILYLCKYVRIVRVFSSLIPSLTGIKHVMDAFTLERGTERTSAFVQIQRVQMKA